MFDESWEMFRAEAYAFNRDREESLIKTWLEKIGYTYKEPIGYYRNSWKHEMEIYSTRIGHLIGKAGVNVDLLKTMLKDEFHGNWNVKFVEVKGGFVQI
jgi:ribosomal protein S3